MSPFVPDVKMNVVLEICTHNAPVTTFLSVPFFNGVSPFPSTFPSILQVWGSLRPMRKKSALPALSVHVMFTGYVSLITHTDPLSLRSAQRVLHAVTIGVYDLE